MEKIKVNVKKVTMGYSVTALRGKLALFNLYKGIGIWNFDAYGIGRSFIESDEFPVEYAKKLCQAICLISLGLTEFPEIELTANAKKLLKIK